MSQGWSGPNLGIGGLSDEELARRSDALLNDPVLNGILDEMEAEALLAWRRSPTPAQREDCWMRISVVTDMKSRLNAHIEDFKMRKLRDRKLAIKRD